MDSLILNRSLKLIENIYDESMYGNTDIFRIKDVIHSLDEGQWKSKQWLVDITKLHYQFPGGKIIILGGWYGLMAYLLRKQFPAEHMHIVSIDSDPRCEELGYHLFGDQDIEFQTIDARDPEVDFTGCTILVSTSVEHFDRAELVGLIQNKPSDCWAVLQSNNMFGHPSHINCSTDILEFSEYVRPALATKRISYSGTLQLNGFQRLMVIGK